MSEREIDASILLEFYYNVIRDAIRAAGVTARDGIQLRPGTRVYETKLPGKLIHGRGGAFRTI